MPPTLVTGHKAIRRWPCNRLSYVLPWPGVRCMTQLWRREVNGDRPTNLPQSLQQKSTNISHCFSILNNQIRSKRPNSHTIVSFYTAIPYLKLFISLWRKMTIIKINFCPIMEVTIFSNKEPAYTGHRWCTPVLLTQPITHHDATQSKHVSSVYLILATI